MSQGGHMNSVSEPPERTCFILLLLYELLMLILALAALVLAEDLLGETTSHTSSSETVPYPSFFSDLSPHDS